MGEGKFEVEVDGILYDIGKFNLPLGLYRRLLIWAVIELVWGGGASLCLLRMRAADVVMEALEYVRRIIDFIETIKIVLFGSRGRS